jgi:hypothetical protein
MARLHHRPRERRLAQVLFDIPFAIVVQHLPEMGVDDGAQDEVGEFRARLFRLFDRRADDIDAELRLIGLERGTDVVHHTGTVRDLCAIMRVVQVSLEDVCLGILLLETRERRWRVDYEPKLKQRRLWI